MYSLLLSAARFVSMGLSRHRRCSFSYFLDIRGFNAVSCVLARGKASSRGFGDECVEDTVAILRSHTYWQNTV